MVTREFSRVLGVVQRFGDRVRGTFKSIFRIVGSLQGLLVAAGGGMLAKSFIDAGAEAEKFRTQLVAVMDQNEQLADSTLKWVRQFAAATPHMTSDVIQAYVQLKAVGVDVSQSMIRTVGDVSYIFDRNISDVSTALIGLETEVLRRLGIQLDRTGKRAVLMSGDMRIETDKTAEAIRAGILEIWEKRFPGAMERAEKDWRGMTALLASQWWEFQVKVMQGGVFEYLKAGMDQVNIRMGDMDKKAPEIAEKIITAIRWVGVGAAHVLDAIDAIRIGINALAIGGNSLFYAWNWLAEKFLGGLILIADAFGLSTDSLERARASAAETVSDISENLKLLITDTKHLTDNFGHNATAAKNFFDELEQGKDKVKDYRIEWAKYFTAEERRGKGIMPYLDKKRAALGELDSILNDINSRIEVPDISDANLPIVDVEQIQRSQEAMERLDAYIDRATEKDKEGQRQRLERLQAVKQTLLEIGDVMINTVLAAFNDWVDGTLKPASQYLKDILRSLANMAIQTGLRAAMQVAVSSITGAAHGGVFETAGRPAFAVPGGYRAFADGGISWRPEFVLRGEAGPEAHIPLRSGKVPVEMKGGGGGGNQINVHFSVQAWDGKDANRAIMQNLPALRGAMMQMLDDNPNGLVRA